MLARLLGKRSGRATMNSPPVSVWGEGHEAVTQRYNPEHGAASAIRKRKYLNNIVEQDHRGVQRITRPMLGFKAFNAAQSTLVSLELMHMIKKRQLLIEEESEGRTAAAQFYTLAAYAPP